MKILMFSMNQEAYRSRGGDFVERHLRYARVSSAEIYIVTLIRDKTRLSPLNIDGTLYFYPVCSANIFFLVMKAIHVVVFNVMRNTKFDLVYTQDPFLTGLLGLFSKVFFSVPFIVGNHSSFIDNQHWIREKRIAFGFLNKIAKIIIRNSDYARVINHHEKQVYIKKIDYSPSRVFVLPTPVNVEKFAVRFDPGSLEAIRAKLGFGPADFLFLWVGRPVPVKGIPLLIQAFERLSISHLRSRLLIIGDSKLVKERSLMKLVESGRFGKSVVWLNKGVPHDELPAYYQLANCLVLPSQYEGFGKVLVEAAVSGVPFISTDNAGARDIVRELGGNLLVPVNDLISLTQAMARMISEYEKFLGDSLRIRRVALEAYSTERSVRAISELWSKVKDSREM